MEFRTLVLGISQIWKYEYILDKVDAYIVTVTLSVCLPIYLPNYIY